jgi:ATP-dependent HslUV protease ATP-binding subunit HslU
VDALAELAADINERIENIGARRLHTVLERLLEQTDDFAPESTTRPLRLTAGGVYRTT